MSSCGHHASGMYVTHVLILGCTPVCHDPSVTQTHASTMALLFSCWNSVDISDLAVTLDCYSSQQVLACMSESVQHIRQHLVLGNFPLACNAFNLVQPGSVSYWTTPLLFHCARLMLLVLNSLLFYCATFMQLLLRPTMCCVGSCQPNLGTCFLRIN